jgi:hypothetical protein
MTSIRQEFELPIRCELQYWSNSRHLRQLYAGLAELARAGVLNVTQRFFEPPRRQVLPQHLREAWRDQARLVLGGERLVHFDMHDSHEVDEIAAIECDEYFKRSYRQDQISPELLGRVKPWGLNYWVEPPYFTPSAWERAWRCERGLDRFREALRFLPGRWSTPTLADLESPPEPMDDPRVLFLTRVWDPQDSPGRSREKIEEMEALNDLRAACIIKLRKAFGSRFLGGLTDSKFARKHYPDALVTDQGATKKRSYLELLRQYPICVTSAGLHGSNGWKLGEYVALSKAIVTEPLQHEVPGAFTASSNYLEFRGPSHCVEAVGELMENREQRAAMMQANRQHYLQWLHPAQLLARALFQAWSEIRTIPR